MREHLAAAEQFLRDESPYLIHEVTPLSTVLLPYSQSAENIIALRLAAVRKVTKDKRICKAQSKPLFISFVIEAVVEVELLDRRNVRPFSEFSALKSVLSVVG